MFTDLRNVVVFTECLKLGIELVDAIFMRLSSHLLYSFIQLSKRPVRQTENTFKI